MRTTVLKWTILIGLLCNLPVARAEEPNWLFLGQSPDESQETSFDGDPDAYTDGNVGSPSWIRPRYWFLPPKFGTYFTADVLFLNRIGGGASNQPLVTNNPPLSTVVMSTNDVALEHQYKPGMLFTLGVNLDQISQIEATYWQVNRWSNSQTVVDNSAFPSLGLAGTLQTVTSDFQLADKMTVNYNSLFNNAELNYKQTIESFTLLAGLRYFRMVENMTIQSTSSVYGTTSDYNVSAVNNLIGFQVGGGWTWDWGPVTLNLLGKVGPYMNAVHQSTLLQDFGNSITLRDYNKDGMPVSVIAETTSNLTYRVTDWFSIHAGHRFLWIQNLAFAPDQLDLANSPPGTQVLNAHNHLWLSGFNAGAEIRW